MLSERVQRQVERLLDEAEAALSRSDWLGVRERCQSVLALDPDNNDARAYLQAADRATANAPATTSDSSPVTHDMPKAPPLPSSFGSGRYVVTCLSGRRREEARLPGP